MGLAEDRSEFLKKCRLPLKSTFSLILTFFVSQAEIFELNGRAVAAVRLEVLISKFLEEVLDSLHGVLTFSL